MRRRFTTKYRTDGVNSVDSSRQTYADDAIATSAPVSETQPNLQLNDLRLVLAEFMYGDAATQLRHQLISGQVNDVLARPKLTEKQYSKFLKHFDAESEEYMNMIDVTDTNCALCCDKLCHDAGLEPFSDVVKDKFAAKALSKTKCNHVFHARCIIKYFQDDSGFQNCPLCRRSVTDRKQENDQPAE